MKRLVRMVPIGDDAVRHLVTLEDESSKGADIRRRQLEFLREVINDGVCAGLLNCGPVPFERFIMTHNGEGWVINLEATENQ